MLLFEAERAWAQSQELHQESLKLASSPVAEDLHKSSAHRKHASRRLLRAVHWTDQLASHCRGLYNQSRLSAEDLAQVTTYSLILNGRLLRQRYEFADAVPQLAVARNLLDELAAAATTSRAQALAIAFADEIGPEIRHCAHELRREKAYDVDGVVAELSPKYRSELVEGWESIIAQLKQQSGATGQDRGKLRELLWEDEPVPVRNPELVDVLLKVQEAEGKLAESAKGDDKGDQSASEEKGKKVGKGARSKRGVASYDAILLALSEAEEVARKLVEAQKVCTFRSLCSTHTLTVS